MENTLLRPSENSGKIFIMYYKTGTILPLEEMYKPLFCGAFPEKKELSYLKDDSEINISDKNEFYSELTGIYWVWKNTSQEFTGICHYRRYFTLYPEPWHHWLKYVITHPFKKRIGPNPLIYTNNTLKWSSKILTFEQVNSIFEEFDAILPLPRRFKYSVKRHYEKYHAIEDLILIEEILKSSYPHMVSCWTQVLDGNMLYGNNMFIMKPKHYQEFMSWWFAMLFEFESRVSLENYEGYQRRILGFVAERLLTLWVIYNKLYVKHLKLLYFKNLKQE